MTTPEPIANEGTPWTTVRELVSPVARSLVGQLVQRQASALATLFYRQMFADPKLAPLLSHDVVSRRLNASMITWLTSLFHPDTPDGELDRIQRQVGEVHARIGISHASVAAAGRLLKRSIAQELRADAAVPDAAAALQYVYELIDIAIDAMTDSMSSAATRLTRSDESYRFHVLAQNLRTERERQKTHLVEWVQQLLMKHYWEEPTASAIDPSGERPSHFELWVDHKAGLLFEDGPEFQALRQAMRRIVGQLLPSLREARDRPADARTIVAGIHHEAGEMKQLLGTLFDRASAMEDGRDHLTRLLNRRYVPSIIKREISLSQASGTPFSLLLMDIDRFADITLAIGASAADLVLSQVADSINESVRASDFVFRVGDDQFLVLLVDASEAMALDIAEALRQTMEKLRLRTPTDLAPQISVSIGVASYGGHPDYEHLLRRTEVALRGAKSSGGNRVVAGADDA